MVNKITAWFQENKLEISIVFLVLLLIFIALMPYTLITIDAGHKGVLWRRFFGGTELDRSWNEGTAIIFPWDIMEIYDLRLRRMQETYNTLTDNGLDVSVSISFRFRPYLEHLPELHRYVGHEYVDVILIPELGAHVRKVISKYSPETLYSANRDEVQKQILDSVREESNVSSHEKDQSPINYILIDDILVTSIVLPTSIIEAIETKEAAKQMSYTYDHKLDIEDKERQRKIIEAEGIRDFQNTITQGISDKYLKWEGIRATLKLSESNNSKVVIIGNQENGLPIILGGDMVQENINNNATESRNLEATLPNTNAIPGSASLTPKISIPENKQQSEPVLNSTAPVADKKEPGSKE